MATDEQLVTLAEIEAEAGWRVPSDVDLNGAVVADWAGRSAVPAWLAAQLFECAVAERDRLALERQQRVDAEVAKMQTPSAVADAQLTAFADNGFRRTIG